MNKHSSGPWKNDGFGVITGGPNHCTSIAETPKCNWHMRGFEELAGQAEANARLIAAAPDLLAALEHMLGACDPTVDREDDEHFDYADAYIACDAARDAIARARGRE